MITRRIASLFLASLAGWAGIQSIAAGSDYGEGLYGWYEAGGSMVQDAKIRDFFDEGVSGNTVKFDPGFHFGIAIGREINPFVRLEVESGYNYNALKSIEGATASSANFYRVPIMGNVVLQYPNRTGFVPFIGAGVGAQWAVCDAQNIEVGATTLSEKSDTWVFGYQGYGGVRYQFRDNMSLGVSYHYSVADAPSWKFSSVPDGNFKLNGIRTHSVSLLLDWTF